jgi:hypothetical protein
LKVVLPAPPEKAVVPQCGEPPDGAWAHTWAAIELFPELHPFTWTYGDPEFPNPEAEFVIKGQITSTPLLANAFVFVYWMALLIPKVPVPDDGRNEQLLTAW